jgi:hypothetical protein
LGFVEGQLNKNEVSCSLNTAKLGGTARQRPYSNIRMLIFLLGGKVNES